MRRPDDDNDLEVVDLAAPQEPAAVTTTGTPISRLLVTAVVVMSTVLLLAAVTWLVIANRPKHETRVVVPPGVAGVDGAGCPANSTCVPVSLQLNALFQATAGLFGADAIVYSVGVHNPAGADAYRSAVVVRTAAGVQIVAVAGCVPNGRAVPARTASLPTVGPVQAVLVTPGATGCSSAVSVSAPAGVPVPREQIIRLAADRDVYG